MAASSSVVTVTTAPTPFVAPDDADGQSIEVYNASAVVVEWGGPTVTFGTGVPIAAGTSRAFDLQPGDLICGVVASGEAECRVGRIGSS